MSSFELSLSKALEDLRSKSLLREPSTFPTHLTDIHSSGLVSFCSNDYLGLAIHPAIRSLSREFLASNRFGSGASRLVSGEYQEHLDLEESISSLVGLPASLTFSSGYAANLGAISALLGPEDVAIVDRQVHASIIDGCRLSRAKLVVFKHGCVAEAENLLSRFSAKPCRKLLITESLFSMSGSISPLEELSLLCKQYDAFLYVDEAHAIGTLGKKGRGVCYLKKVVPDVLVGTFGKSFGTFGAFVSGSKSLRDFLVNRARSFIYSTSVPPLLAFAAKAGVILATSEEGESLRSSLYSRIAEFRKGLSLPELPLPSPIIPWILGDENAALEASSLLRQKGFFVQAIRPPTVKVGTSRLRFTFSALHTIQDIQRLILAIKSLPYSSSSSDFVE